MRWCWDVNEQYISVPNALISDRCPAVGVSQSLDADLDFFDIISSPVYRFSKYQTETLGAFSFFFLLPLMIERLTHQYHLSYKGQRVLLAILTL